MRGMLTLHSRPCSPRVRATVATLPWLPYHGAHVPEYMPSSQGRETGQLKAQASVSSQRWDRMMCIRQQSAAQAH